MNIDYLKKVIRKLPKNSRILDVGCGNGRISSLIRKIRKDIKFYGVDLDKRFKNQAPGFMKFYVGDAKKTPFKDSFFDLIVCFHLIEHLQKPEKAFREFYRILKKEGKLLVESPNLFCCFVPSFLGYNFYQDRTHVRPLTRNLLLKLGEKFKLEKLKNDFSIHRYFNKISKLKSVLGLFGFDKTVIWGLFKK